MTLDEQVLSHVTALELVHEPKWGTYFQGFHYDLSKRLQRMGFISVTESSPREITNIIKTKAKLREGSLKDKTFFPAYWTVDDILHNAQEALYDIIECKYSQNKRYTIIGQNKTGVSIKFSIDNTGKIISFYPNI